MKQMTNVSLRTQIIPYTEKTLSDEMVKWHKVGPVKRTALTTQSRGDCIHIVQVMTFSLQDAIKTLVVWQCLLASFVYSC